MSLLHYQPFFDTFFNELYNSNEKSYHIEKKDKEYVLSLIVTGRDKEDLSIYVDRGVLRISTPEARGTPLASSIDMSYKLPRGVLTESIHAKIEQGILFVSLPISEVKNTRQYIEIG